MEGDGGVAVHVHAHVRTPKMPMVVVSTGIFRRMLVHTSQLVINPPGGNRYRMPCASCPWMNAMPSCTIWAAIAISADNPGGMPITNCGRRDIDARPAAAATRIRASSVR